MSQFDSDHSRICADFVRNGRRYLADGELLQASEKGWGAAAHAAKVYADARDYDYRSHSHFNHVVLMLAQESGDRTVIRWADSANGLHNNFYLDWYDAEMVSERLDDIEKFVHLIADLTDVPLTN